MNNKETYTEPIELRELGEIHGKNLLQNIDNKLFNEPYFLEYIRGFVEGLENHAILSKEYQNICKQN